MQNTPATIDTSPVYIKTSRLTLFARRQGAGPRLLFLGGTGWDLRTDSAPFQTPLAKHFDITHFDQRGMGQTELIAGPYSMQDYAADAKALLDELSWDNVLVIGFSFGGMVAQELSIRYPEKVGAMALISTTSGGAGGSSYPIHEFCDWELIEKTRRALEVSDLRFSTEYQSAHPAAAKQAILDRLPSNPEFMQAPGALEGRNWQLAARAQHDCFDRLNQITAPTLVIGGESDGQAPGEAVENLANAIPGAVLKMLPGAHGLIFENDDAFNAVTEFFHALDNQHL